MIAIHLCVKYPLNAMFLHFVRKFFCKIETVIAIHLCVKYPLNAMFRKKLCSNVIKGTIGESYSRNSLIHMYRTCIRHLVDSRSARSKP